MAEVEFMHLCDYAFQAEGGKACIIGIFDGIGAHVFPATHMLMTIAVKFQGQMQRNGSTIWWLPNCQSWDGSNSHRC